MAQRHILFTINHAPFGSIFYTEGLRAVVGATAGIDEHTVDVVYLGEGVYYALKGVDRSDARVYLETLSKMGVKLKAERESLEERNVRAEEVAEDIEVIPRAAVHELIAKADFTMDF